MSKIESEIFLTYDDVLLRPGYSEILPSETNLKSRFSKNIPIRIPLISAAMDTVTEAPVAIIMAQMGGIGVIHKNLPIDRQAREVEKVKKYESGMILNPVTVDQNATLSKVVEITRGHKITGVPVVDENQHLVGILTSRDMQFEEDYNKKVKEVMTPKKRLISAKEGISLKDAQDLLHQHRIEKLPIVDDDFNLKGLITITDILKKMHFPDSNKDQFGRLRVAAAVGVGEKEFIRVKALAESFVDAIVVDTAHGHSKGVIEMIKRVKSEFPDIDVVAGNVATREACEDLIKVGADAIKVGIGPGSICTTRVIAGIGVPQFSAVKECAEVCNEKKIPLIADGGVKYSGDIVKALAIGASCVMVGSLFAGCDETPGETVLYQGRTYKVYRGMGSLGAMSLGSKDRYGQGAIEEIQKLVPEGIEGQVPYRGSLATTIYQLLGGIKAGMGYVGSSTLEVLREKANFITITQASLKESHPHDIMVTKEAPNYQANRQL